jgi:hypothetical protein
VLLQGGLSTGKTTADNCEIVRQLPEMLNGLATLAVTNVSIANAAFTTPTAVVPGQFCRQESPFLAQFKLIGSYIVPKVDVQVSGTFQSIPGPQVAANYVATNAQIAPSLGRNLSGTAANVTVVILEPGAIYGERLNQLDLRFAKILRLNRTRTTVGLDLANALNANPVLTESSAYATWHRPQSILSARFAKLSVQFDF